MFAIQQAETNEVYEIDDLITFKQKDKYTVVPRHFYKLDELYPDELIYVLFGYCFLCFRESLWGCTEQFVLEVVKKVQIMHNALIEAYNQE